NLRNDSPEGAPSFISARYVSENEIRGVSQTFTWNATSDMTGFGLKIADSGTWKKFSAAQDYRVDIQELSDAVQGRHVVATVASLPATIPLAAVVAGEYLFIGFDRPVP